jgi:integrase
MYSYIVLSLLIGARTEELRALTWAHVDLDGKPEADPPSPAVDHGVEVRAGQRRYETKKPRRTLAMPVRCVDALRRHRQLQQAERDAAGGRWQDNNLVFASRVGTERNSGNVLRSFRVIVARTELNEQDWTPREMRHSFVICRALAARGTAKSRAGRVVPHKYPRHRQARAVGPVPSHTPSSLRSLARSSPWWRLDIGADQVKQPQLMTT